MLLAGNASAIGLGELRGQPALGDRIRLEISLLGAEKVHLDPACFRLVQPSSNGDLPWLKKAGLSVRKGTPPVLEIRSEVPLREPVLQIGVYIGCGHEVSREYVVMASPAGTVATPMVEPGRAGADVAPPTLSEVTQPAPPRAKKFVPREAEVPSRIVPRKPEKRPAGAALPDRLMLSDGTGLGEPSLRLSTALLAGTPEAKESQREILRLEYRMLTVLHEQVTTQMVTAEKLRNMEGMLNELQQRTSEFAQRVEQNSASIESPTSKVDLQAAQSSSPVSAIPARKPAAAVGPSSGISEWSLYGILLGVFLGLGGWLAWRNYRERRQPHFEDEDLVAFPEFEIDPKRDDEVLKSLPDPSGQRQFIQRALLLVRCLREHEQEPRRPVAQCCLHVTPEILRAKQFG